MKETTRREGDDYTYEELQNMFIRTKLEYL